MDFKQLQEEQKPWREHNFPNRDTYYPLLGAVEELGELAHSYLKWKQEIRGTEEMHISKMKDSICDAVVFLADFCTAMGFDFQKEMEVTWSEVKHRDWVRFPKNGVSE